MICTFNFTTDDFGNVVRVPYRTLLMMLNHCFPACEDHI